jgi:predicted aspartyl protease
VLVSSGSDRQPSAAHVPGRLTRAAIALRPSCFAAVAGLVIQSLLFTLSNAIASSGLPEGAQTVPFENLEGVILIHASIRSTTGKDTSGIFVLDTGAGHVAIDDEIAQLFDMKYDNMSGTAVGVAQQPLQRLEIGAQQIDQLSPILVINADIVRSVADRPVLGLIGQQAVANQAIVIDYRREELTMIPLASPRLGAPGDVLSPQPAAGKGRDARPPESKEVSSSRAALGDSLTGKAIPVPFVLAGDGRILVTAHAASPNPRRPAAALTLMLDTGATKTVLFEDGLRNLVPDYERWPTLKGLSAPTLMGSAEARLARVPRMWLDAGGGRVTGRAVDVAILQSGLAPALARDVGRPVNGLLGYSFLRRFRVIVDYPNAVLWFTPVPHGYDERPFEYTHVGIQIERRGEDLVVVGLATGSPAAEAGIARGDVIVALDGKPADDLDVVTASRMLEGPPQSRVRVTLRRKGETRTYSLIRRRLL